MALPSQSARNRNSSYGPRFTVSRRRPQRGRARLIFAVVILLGGLTAIYLFQLGGDDGSGGSVATATDTQEGESGGDTVAEEAPIRRPLTAGSGAGSGSEPARVSRTRDLVMGVPERQPEAPTPTRPDPQRDPLELEKEPKAPATTPQRAPTTPANASPSRSSEVQSLIASADRMMAEGRVIQARDALNRALHHPRASGADRALMRNRLTELAAELTFSSKIVPGDEIAYAYTVKGGDLLSTIVSREGLDVEWMLIERINKVSANRIRVGQTLKLLRGPFHAVITKSAYRLDLYSDFRDSAGERIYLGSFNVGLGEYDSTPVGSWVVRKNSKLIDPAWVNPRTGERFASKDPENPIGNRWVGIRGTDANTEKEEGIGIHGTIEPESIGNQASMGCVRMLKADVELMYDLLVPEVSTVVIQP